MSNSRARLNKEVVFSQVLNYADDIRYSSGVLTGILIYENERAYFGGSSYITYIQSIPGIKSIRISGVILESVTDQQLLYLNASQSISIVNGVVTATGISSPTIYVDGVQTTTFTTSNREIMVVTSTNITATLPKLGTVTTPMTGYIGLCTMMVRAFSAVEVSNLFFGKYYIEPDTTGLLLDFDARQVSPKDNTGLNTLTYTPGLGGSNRIGRNYAYKFDGLDTKIDLGTDIIGVGGICISVWFFAISLGENNLGRLLTNQYFRLRLGVSNTIVISNDGVVSASSSTTNSFSFCRWTNVVVNRYTNGTMDMYVNASLSGLAGRACGTPTVSSLVTTIGNGSSQSFTHNGFISRMKVASGIWDAQKISQEFTSQKAEYGL